MAYNSFVFWLVFPVFFLLYWAFPDKIAIRGRNASHHTLRPRNFFLVLSSYLFYANWNPSFTFVLLFVTFTTYAGGFYVYNKEDYKKSLLFIALIVLSPLLLFKYYSFINTGVWCLLSSFGLRYEINGLKWAVPIGISFYSFQALGYLFDVSSKRVTLERSIVDYALFVCFFPQLFSGPISKADELIPQIKQEKRFSYSQSVRGLEFILWGLFLKVVLADRLGLYVDKVFTDYEMYSGSTCILATFFYSLQIYGDFAGYSLMAVGTAKALGFDLIINFNRPYFAVSVTDFWHRWHISLSRWLKDYIYIPLGGSRCSKIRNYWNILVTFLVSGIWHGANWTFIVWGFIHGFVQIVEKALGLNKKDSSGLLKVLRVLLTFLVINVAWVVFRSPSIIEAWHYFRHSFSSFGIPSLLSKTNFLICIFAIIILLIKDAHEELSPKSSMLFNNRYFRWIGYVALFCFTILCGALDSGSFIYGSF